MADTEKTTQVEESVIGKITMATIGCKPRKVEEIDGDKAECPLARIYGQMHSVKYQNDTRKATETGAVQTFTYFTGSFEAVNMQNGEVFRSGKLFLPKGISELVEAGRANAQAAAEKRGGTVESVEFAFEIRSIKDKNPQGYTYKVYILKNTEPVDELKAIRQLVANAGTIEHKKLGAAQTGQGPKVVDGGTGASQNQPQAGKKTA